MPCGPRFGCAGTTPRARFCHLALVANAKNGGGGPSVDEARLGEAVRGSIYSQPRRHDVSVGLFALGFEIRSWLRALGSYDQMTREVVLRRAANRRARHDRQWVCLWFQALCPNHKGGRRSPYPYKALSAPDQWQGKALHLDHAARMGLCLSLSDTGKPKTGHRPLEQCLQSAKATLGNRRQKTLPKTDKPA